MEGPAAGCGSLGPWRRLGLIRGPGRRFKLPRVARGFKFGTCQRPGMAQRRGQGAHHAAIAAARRALFIE